MHPMSNGSAFLMRAVLRIRPDGIYKGRHLGPWHLEATQRAHARFLLNAVKKFRSRRYRGVRGMLS